MIGTIGHLPYILVAIMVSICIYAALFKSNLFKKMLAIFLLTDAVNLLYILQGYRSGSAIPPIIPPGMDPSEFASIAVDPLAHYFVVTAVVIGLAEVATLTALIIYTYKYYGTMETKKIKELRG
ncbi:MAG: NADH-quinone oxidoreductase subunit K [Candidatus Methanosuratus sp.]|nr:NADH-quinone oxidoreductase subunit K [Candidatus Methanosuratincola sp.]